MPRAVQVSILEYFARDQQVPTRAFLPEKIQDRPQNFGAGMRGREVV